MLPNSLLLLLLLLLPASFLPLALSATIPAASPAPYVGLSVFQGSVADPCTPLSASATFNLKPPVAWLAESPESHCLPGVPGSIHNITCVTRRTDTLPGDDALDTKISDMTKCDLWGFTEAGCQGKYWVAGRNDPLAGNATQSWIWTEEERESGPDLLDIQSWQVDCRP